MRTVAINECKLSLVTPARNESNGIEAAVHAFAKILNEITTHWEIIVVDDGSVDDIFLCGG